MVLDLENLVATLLMFDPDKVESIKPKAFRPPKDWSNRGHMTRICLSILRQASEPLTWRDIAVQLLIERALHRDDQKLLRLMTMRVGVALRGQRDKGVVTGGEGPGQYVLWQITRLKNLLSLPCRPSSPQPSSAACARGRSRCWPNLWDRDISLPRTPCPCCLYRTTR